MSSRMACRLVALVALAASGCADLPVGDGEEVGEVEDGQSEIAAQQNPNFTCTEPEIEAVLLAAYVANGAVTQAARSTPANDPRRWEEWFTTAVTPAQRDRVISILNDIRRRTLLSELRCLKNDGRTASDFAECNQINVAAFVRPGQLVINLCPVFFRLSPLWQVNVLVHEAAHLSLGEPDHTVNGTALLARMLADIDLSLALRNASNYAHFVTNDPTMNGVTLR
ncbi:MAG: M35 family metallo-endopeptidase [Polyangiales bacterium]